MRKRGYILSWMAILSDELNSIAKGVGMLSCLTKKGVMWYDTTFLGERDIIGLDGKQNRLLFLDAEDDLDEILVLHKSLLKR